MNDWIIIIFVFIGGIIAGHPINLLWDKYIEPWIQRRKQRRLLEQHTHRGSYIGLKKKKDQP